MIGIYCRVSSQEQEKKFSIPAQKKEGIEFALKNHEEYKVFVDAETGTKINENLEKLFSDIKNKIINTVWIIDQDRISRDISDSQRIKTLFISHNCKLFIKDTIIDFSDLDSEFMYGIKSVIADYERKKIAERTSRGRRESRDRGNLVVGNILGYSFKFNKEGKKIWFIVEEEINTVKKIYELHVAEKTLGEITKKLEDDNHQTKFNGKWTKATVRRILRNIVYTGNIYDSGGKIISSNIYKEIIPLKQFKEINDSWKSKISDKSNFKKYSRHLLSGIIACEKCNTGIVFSDTSKREFVKKNREKGREDISERYFYYVLRCKKECIQKKQIHIREDLNNFIFENLYYFVFSDRKQIKKLLDIEQDKIKTDKEENRENLLRYNNRIEKIKIDRDKLLNLILKNIISEDDIKDKMNTLKKEENILLKNIKDINKNIALSEENYEYILQEFKEDNILKFIFASEARKRQILLKTIKSCTMNGEREIEIEFITGNKFTYQNFPYKTKNVIVETEKRKIFIDMKKVEDKITYDFKLDIEQKEFLNWIHQTVKNGPEEINPF